MWDVGPPILLSFLSGFPDSLCSVQCAPPAPVLNLLESAILKTFHFYSELKQKRAILVSKMGDLLTDPTSTPIIEEYLPLVRGFVQSAEGGASPLKVNIFIFPIINQCAYNFISISFFAY